MDQTRALNSAPRGQETGLLYPALLVAAAIVTVLSVIGIAATTGMLPSTAQFHGRSASVTPSSNPAAGALVAAAVCIGCGTVSAIRARESTSGGETSPGAGASRTGITTVAAGAGAPEAPRANTSYEIRVRMDDGSYRTFFERSRPAFAVGQVVRVSEDGLTAAR